MLDRIRDMWRSVQQDRVPRLVMMLFLIIVMAAVTVYIIEHLGGNKLFFDIGDAFWWAIVTMFTVGYGDITPVTPVGRFFSLFVMISGISLTALLTAAIASYFVEKRILEGKGMEDVKFKKHIVICGWNSRAMNIVERLISSDQNIPPIVFINELPEEHIVNILEACKGTQAKYVKGDYVHEGVLKRANVRDADSVILLIDTHGGKPGTRPDDRNVMASYAIKGLNSKIRLCAEIEHPESVSLLKRAGVDMLAPLGGFNDFILANAATSPGVTLAVQEILTFEHSNLLKQRSFPSSLVDKNFSEAISYFRATEGGLLIGVAREEEEGMSLDDILSGDMSAIDRFIKKKFEGLEKDYFTISKKLIVNINPPDDYTIRHNDMALVITREEKAS